MPSKLIDGVRRFQQSIFPQKKGLFEQLGKGQHPRFLVITCSDSRIDPSLLMSSDPGDLFVIRNAGNLMPPKSDRPTGESATLEYAVRVLKVKVIVVCGHASCGAMDALTKPGSTDGLEEVPGWLDLAADVRDDVLGAASFANDAERIEMTVKRNVLQQLKNLETFGFVKELHDAHHIMLMGWYYDFEHGSVECYDPTTGAFSDIFTGIAGVEKTEALRDDIKSDLA